MDDEILNPLEEDVYQNINTVFTTDDDDVNDLEPTDDIEEPEDDGTIPDETTDDGEGGEAGSGADAENIDEIEPNELDDVNDLEEENDLTEYDVAVEETPVEPLISNTEELPSIGNIQQGERVMIALINGEATVLGTVGSGDRQQRQIQNIADIAGNTNQYFWHSETGTDTGAHITEIPQAQFITNPSGGNTLIRSNGMAVRNGLTELAKFSADGIQIGKNNESRLQQDYHSLQLIDKEGRAYVYFSDLRNTDGVALIQDDFIGDGSAKTFTLSIAPVVPHPDYPFTVTVDGVEKEGSGVDYSYTNTELTFVTAPASGSEIVVTYYTISPDAKAYTLGLRKSGTNIGAMSFAQGNLITATGYSSHAEGYYTETSGKWAHAEGNNTKASGKAAHAEGTRTIAKGNYSHAEGDFTEANYDDAHAEGRLTKANAIAAHAEGISSTAGYCAHAEGHSTRATGYYSHAEGDTCYADAKYAHAQNLGTIASGEAQTAIGKYNVQTSNYALIIGNGIATKHSNALTVDWDGLVSITNPEMLTTTDSAPSASKWLHLVEGLDSSGEIRSYLAEYCLSGSTEQGVQVETKRKIGGSYTYNGIRFGIDSTGARNVYLQDPKAFRIGLGANADGAWPASLIGGLPASKITSGTLPINHGGTGSTATTTETTVANIITADDNVTITGAAYAQWGKVAQVYLLFTTNVAITVPASGNIGNLTIGTLVSGKRPAISSAGYSNGDGAGTGAAYNFGGSGVIKLGAVNGTGEERTIAKGASFSFYATYLLA